MSEEKEPPPEAPLPPLDLQKLLRLLHPLQGESTEAWEKRVGPIWEENMVRQALFLGLQERGQGPQPALQGPPQSPPPSTQSEEPAAGTPPETKPPQAQPRSEDTVQRQGSGPITERKEVAPSGRLLGRLRVTLIVGVVLTLGITAYAPYDWGRERLGGSRQSYRQPPWERESWEGESVGMVWTWGDYLPIRTREFLFADSRRSFRIAGVNSDLVLERHLAVEELLLEYAVAVGVALLIGLALPGSRPASGRRSSLLLAREPLPPRVHAPVPEPPKTPPPVLTDDRTRRVWISRPRMLTILVLLICVPMLVWSVWSADQSRREMDEVKALRANTEEWRRNLATWKAAVDLALAEQGFAFDPQTGKIIRTGHKPRSAEETILSLLRQEAQALKQARENVDLAGAHAIWDIQAVEVKEQPGNADNPWAGTIHFKIKSRTKDVDGSIVTENFDESYAYSVALKRWILQPGQETDLLNRLIFGPSPEKQSASPGPLAPKPMSETEREGMEVKLREMIGGMAVSAAAIAIVAGVYLRRFFRSRRTRKL